MAGRGRRHLPAWVTSTLEVRSSRLAAGSRERHVDVAVEAWLGRLTFMAPRFVRKDQLQRTNFEVIAPRVAVVAEPPVHEASPKVAGSHLGEADLGTPQDCRPASLESGSSDDRSGQLVQRGDGPPERRRRTIAGASVTGRARPAPPAPAAGAPAPPPAPGAAGPAPRPSPPGRRRRPARGRGRRRPGGGPRGRAAPRPGGGPRAGT